MSYMNEEYKSRFGMNRANMYMDGTTWSSRNRAVSRDSGNRGDMTWGSGNRDDASRGSMVRGDVTWSNVKKDHLSCGSMNRDGMTWGSGNRDDASRGSMFRGDVTWSNVKKDHLSRGSMNRDDMTWGTMKSDVSQGSMNRGDFSQGNMSWGDSSQGNMNKDYVTWGSVNREDINQGSMNREDMNQGNWNQSGTNQEDFNLGDTSQAEMNRRDAPQSDATESDSIESDTDDVTYSDPNKDTSVMSDRPEDDERKLFCGVCRVTCSHFAGYRLHVQGTKHSKKVRASTMSCFNGIYKYQKYNRTGKTLMDYINDPFREPLIGLEHVLEYTLPGRLDPHYHCDLCECKLELAPMIAHINGLKHRRAYAGKEFPFLLNVPIGRKEDKASFFRRMAADIEADEGLKMYRSDLPSKEKKIQSLPEIKPDEIPIKKSRWDTNNETLKVQVLQSIDTFEIDCDSEALLVMTITQDLTEHLKTYCLKVKEKTEHAEQVARAKCVAELAQRTALQDSFGEDRYPSGSGNWKLEPIHQNQPSQYAGGGPNWKRETMHNQPALGRGNWDREVIMQNPLPQKAQYGTGRGNLSPDAMVQVRQALKAYSAQSTPEQPSASFGRLSDPLGPKGNSELIQFSLSEPRGPGGFPSGNRGFGNEYSRFDRGPLHNSMATGPSPLFAQANVLQRSNPSAPGLGRMFDVPRGEKSAAGCMRVLQNQGTRFQPAGTPANFSAGPKRMPANLDIQERMNNIGYSKFLPPSNTHLNADRMPFGPSAAMELPTASAPEKTENKASPLTAEILHRIRGKDVRSASAILSSLAATNPALLKVNIANLLNLLLQTGTIK